MKYGIFATTKKGAELALRIKAILSEDITAEVNIFIKKGKCDVASAIEYDKLSEIVKKAFGQYDALIFVMATGIVVRIIANLLVSKLKDPAVLVLDEEAKHVISLLSGHVGGANALTRKLALALDSDPVITTATDVNMIIAPDALAAELGLKVYPKENIQLINGALLDGKTVNYYIDKDMYKAELYQQRILNKGLSVHLIDIADLDNAADNLRVVISDKELFLQKNTLFLCTRKLVAGLGCRRGTPMEHIYDALVKACAVIGRDVSEVDMLASAAVKSDEEGMLLLAKKLNREIRFFMTEDLQKQVDRYDLSTSDFVKKNVGVGNVSEAAALCCVQQGQILLHKMKLGKVTVALIWEK